VRTLFDHDRRDVLDVEQGFLAVATQCASAQTQLDRTAFQRATERVMVGVPLQAYIGAFDGSLPVLVRCETCGVAEQLVGDIAAQAHGEDAFLAFLRRPAGAEHPPEEVRLDPAHAGVAELAAEALVLHREVGDGRAIGLVDDDAGVVVLGEDAAAALRPLGLLFGVAGRDQGWMVNDARRLSSQLPRQCAVPRRELDRPQ
jgi:hypothetical protein